MTQITSGGPNAVGTVLGMGSLFGQETAVSRDPSRAGGYLGELSDDWLAPLVPQGGVLAAAGARAMAAALDEPGQHLRTISTVFAGRVSSGPVEVDATVLRRGRSMSQAIATVRNAGEPAGATSVAVFGASRPGFEFTDIEMPVVPPPDECPSWRDPPPPEAEERRFNATYWDQIEGRAALGHAPWEVYESSSSERAAWYRFDEPPVGDEGLLDRLALVSLCDTMPGAVWERTGSDVPNFMPPSADLTVHVFQDAGPGWLLMHNFARHAGDGFASLELRLWDPDRGLVAYGTQMMFFVFPDGPPTE